MMVTLDPATDAETARVMLRELAHNTRTMTPPTETATMIGSLASGLAALREILDELSGWHERSADGALDPTGDGDAGYRSALDVAMHLSQAALEIERAATGVAAAHDTARGITWPAAQQRELVRPSQRHLAPPSLFGANVTAQATAGIGR